MVHKIYRFDQFIFRKIIKFVATRAHLLTLKCTILDFGWGCASDPTRGAHSDPLDSFYF